MDTICDICHKRKAVVYNDSAGYTCKNCLRAYLGRRKAKGKSPGKHVKLCKAKYERRKVEPREIEEEDMSVPIVSKGPVGMCFRIDCLNCPRYCDQCVKHSHYAPNPDYEPPDLFQPSKDYGPPLENGLPLVRMEDNGD